MQIVQIQYGELVQSICSHFRCGHSRNLVRAVKHLPSKLISIGTFHLLWITLEIEARFGGVPPGSQLTTTTTLPALLHLLQGLKRLEFYFNFSIRLGVSRNEAKRQSYKDEASVRLREDIFHLHIATYRFAFLRRTVYCFSLHCRTLYQFPLHCGTLYHFPLHRRTL